MTVSATALHRVGMFQPGYRAPDWTNGKAADVSHRDLTGTC